MLRTLAVFLVIMATTSCGTIPQVKHRSVFNSASTTRWEPGPVKPHRATFKTMPAFVDGTRENPRRQFVGISLSGGGTRAAVFSAAVLEELEKIGLLGEAYAISSVSGGSLTSAYYASNPPSGDPAYWPKFQEVVSQDLLTPWMLRAFSPHNILSLSLTTKDRSDVMADVMDDRVFAGATFSDMATRPTRGSAPLILINSTLASTVESGLFLMSDLGPWYAGGFNAPFIAGERFTFTEHSIGRLGSEINDLRLADAVMASGAFPGVFGTRTLGAFRSLQDQSAGDAQTATSTSPLSYVHLIDGGAADNLGADALSLALLGWHQSSFSAELDRTVNEGRGRNAGCLLILVDSSTGTEKDDSRSADPRSPLVDYVVDTNALDAIDAMMKRRRVDTLYRMGIDLTKRDFGKIRQRVNPEARLTHVFDPGFKSDGVRPPAPSCFVWHISLDRVDEILESEPYETWEISPQQEDAYRQLFADKYRLGLAVTARGFETNYKLKSPECRPTDMQFVLRAAARELVARDSYVRGLVCDWMEEQQLAGASSCRSAPAERMEPLPDCVAGSKREPPHSRGRLTSRV